MKTPTKPSLRGLVVFGAFACGTYLSAQTTAPDQPAQEPEPAASVESLDRTGDNVIRLDDFKVTAQVGHYAEKTSSMATKLPIDMKFLSSSLQILNANAIGDRKAQNLADLYPYVIGMTRESNNSNGFTIRGFSNSGSFTQNIAIDGLMGITSSRGSVSTANVDRLEILKGPNSVLYGQMNPGGLINIITKRPQARRSTTVTGAFTSYAGRYSSLGDDLGYTVSIDHTGPIDDAKHWLYRVVASGQDTDFFRKGVYQSAFYVYPSLSYVWSPRTTLTIQGELAQEKRGSDDGLLAPNNNLSLIADYNVVYQEPTDVDRDYGEAFSTSFSHEFANKWVFRAQTRTTWQVATRKVMSTVGQVVVIANPIANSTVRRRYQNQKNGHRYNYFDASIHGTMGPENFKHTLLIGTGGGAEQVNNRRIAFGPNVTPVNVYNPVLGVTPYPADGTGAKDPYNNLYNFGQYVSDQVQVGKKLRLSLGIRHDQQNSWAIDKVDLAVPYASANPSKMLYQAGVVYSLTDALSAYGSFSQSFKPQDVVTIDANGKTGFPPETAEQFETGLKFETADRKMYATLALYQIKKTNVATNTGITFIPTGQAINRIDGEQTSKGLEFEANWQPIPNWQIQAGLAYMEATITQSLTTAIVGKYLANAPKKTANLWTRYNFPSAPLKGLGVGLGLIYVGDRFGGSPDTTSYYLMPAYTRADTSLYYQWHRYNFALNVANVLDKKYIASARVATVIVPGDPRKVTLTASVRF